MTRQRRYAKADLAQRGTELFETQVRAKVESGNQGKVAAIDVDTGSFEVGDSPLEASAPLLARLPDAQIWCVRIGGKPIRRFGRSLRMGVGNA